VTNVLKRLPATDTDFHSPPVAIKTEASSHSFPPAATAALRITVARVFLIQYTKIYQNGENMTKRPQYTYTKLP
jgi:hypothetical protein